MTSKHHLPAELQWRAIGRLEVRLSQTEVEKWLSMSPSVVQTLWRQFQTTDSASKRFSQEWPIATVSTNNRYLTLCAFRSRTASQTFLRSSLAVATGRLVLT